ncbi:SOS response-associated peptidase [bacterium]|nr:SOS response-associated peptidase [bacterium]
MCAQYVLTTWASELARKYNIEIGDDFNLNFRVLPYSPSIVIVNHNNKRQFQKMNFSLVPSWSKESKVKFATHNARIETILEKPSWKTPFVSKRCLVPITVFVESIYENKYAGHMVRFSEVNNSVLTAAGIWDSWLDSSTQTIVNSFAIITDEPPSYIAEAGHDRCPVFLNEDTMFEWINPKNNSPEFLINFLKINKRIVDFKAEIDRPLKEGWENRK